MVQTNFRRNLNNPAMTDTEHQYRKTVYKLYNCLPLTELSERELTLRQIPLDQIFIKLILATTIKPSDQSESKSLTIAAALQQHHRLIIIGAPGSGKTTLLRWLAVTFARHQQAEPDRLGTTFTEPMLPILIELRCFQNGFQTRTIEPATVDLAKEISMFISKDTRFEDISETWMHETLLAPQPRLLLLDGLDEITNQSLQQRFLEALGTFVQRYPQIHCVLTTRSLGFRSIVLEDIFQQIHLKPFRFKEITQFIHHWYDTAYDLEAQQLINKINDNSSVAKLATNPLLCTLLTITYHNNRVLPQRRVELYFEYSKNLLEEDKLKLLEPVAYEFHKQTQLALPEEQVIKKLTSSLENEQRAREFIRAICDQNGLLQKRSDGTLEFVHRCWQEYLAARYIAVQPETVVIDKIMTHLYEGWWREVHLLVIGYLGSERDGSDQVTRLMLTILNVYKAPSRWLLPPHLEWLHELDLFEDKIKFKDKILRYVLIVWILGLNLLGKWLPWLQWRRRIAWQLMREFEFVAQGYAECTLAGRTATLSKALSELAVERVSEWIYNSLYHRSGQLPFLIKTMAHFDLPRDAVASVLITALQHKNWHVQYPAAKSLGHLDLASEPVVAALEQTLLDENKGDLGRGAAAESLGRLGQLNENSIAFLVQVLQNDYMLHLQRGAAKGLGHLSQASEPVVMALVQALLNDDGLVQQYAAKSLYQLGQVNQKVLTYLIQAWQAEDPNSTWLLHSAVERLDRLGDAREVVIEGLLAALHDPKLKVRIAAAESLGQLSDAHDMVIEGLLVTLRDPEPWVRSAAAKSLGQLGDNREAVIEALLTGCYDPEYWVPGVTADSSLVQLGYRSERVIEGLSYAFGASADWVRQDARNILNQFSDVREAVIERLLTDLKYSEYEGGGRMMAAFCLSQLGDTRQVVIDGLLAASQQDTEDWVRRGVAKILAHLNKVRQQGGEVPQQVKVRQPEDEVPQQVTENHLDSLKIEDKTQLEHVLINLCRSLHDFESEDTLKYLRKLLESRPIPGYRWKSLAKRRK